MDSVACICAGDLPERVLHVLHSDTAAGVGVDAKRPSDPLSAAVQASLTTQFVGNIRRAVRDKHYNRYDYYCHRVSALPHAGPRTAGEIILYSRHVTRYLAQC